MNRSNLEIEKKEEEKRESKRKFGSADWRGERHHPQEGKGRIRSEKGRGDVFGKWRTALSINRVLPKFPNLNCEEMVCNGVKYYPEKDADSYYARPRSESFNPMTSPSLFLFSYPHTCRKMLTCHFHCQSVTRGIQRERSSAERGLRKRGIYTPRHLLFRPPPSR